jgi:uncharacterized protein (TIGR02231 family)
LFQTMELTTAIAATTVYPDRARVTRSGTVSLEAGVHNLEIADLPLALDRASVRASAQGTARARLLGVDVRQVFYAETPAERTRELEQQLEALADELQALQKQGDLLEREKTTVAELAGQTRVYARGMASGKTTLEGQLTLLDGLRSRSEAIDKAQLELGVRQREQQRQHEKLKRELDLLRASKPSQRYAAVIEVEVLQAGELTVELTYVVADAGWLPLYDVRLRESDVAPRLEVGYLAQVTQRTGEEWQKVALALSTARPALAGRLPELKPWYIAPLAPPPAKAAFAPAPATAGAGAPAFLARAAEASIPMPALAPVPAEQMTATVESSSAAVTYRVPAAVTIPADGAPHKVTIARYELSPRLDYVTAPKLVEASYRRATVVNDSPYTLLPGEANLFAGDEFIGRTPVKLTAPQGEIELYLGVDDRVKIKRELKRRDVDRQFMGSRRRLHYAYETTIENLLTSEVSVTLRDQIPVSRHEEVRVKLDVAEPKPTEQTELNELKWELRLAPAQKVVVRLEFTVEHPQDMVLSGMLW